ncbi:helicase-related protein [Bacillus sp. REN16]|uniref:helicase-related protein n=1 Tax=Bacillus sp. REN16 TaxID=2887296 RepID=UPI001E5F875F|nr:helicase-related protein [Bacillus sp. REN16]MCC3359104.1 helicase C-terminal domain-containing protein [Bacillus sp. REN16]
MLSRNVTNRDKLIKALQNELIGPIPVNKEWMKPLKIDDVIEFKTKEEMYDYYYNSDSGEEVLQVNTPVTQYSAGLLFPLEAKKDDIDDTQNTMEELIDDSDEEILGKDALKQLINMEKRREQRDTEDEEEDIPDLMPGKNDFAPSSMALSFYAQISDERDLLKVRLNGGIYRPFKVKLAKTERMHEWWYRLSAVFREKMEEDYINFEAVEFVNKKRWLVEKTVMFNNLQFRLQLYSRMISDTKYLITLSATNITQDSEGKKLRDMEKILLQSQLSIELSGNNAQFLPYPSDLHGASKHNDEEVLSAQLLYRNAKNFALGHGCSADWELDRKEEPTRLFSTFMPEYETSNMTPDIKDENGNEFSISMLELAGVVPNSPSPDIILGKIILGYKNWIELREAEIPEIEKIDLRKTAESHMMLCREALSRMEKGLKCLEDENVLLAFQFANHAMAIQQIVGAKERGGKRIDNLTVMDDKLQSYEIPEPDELIKNNKGKWRAFQAAFLLMSLPSFYGDDKKERDIVDLIWFPTGGGKTEAYLGVAAFSMFYRRLKNKNDAGTDVIMRYTLRLLTADQFQRSSRLICALEMLRRKNIERLGGTPFSIGIWLGSKTTPNRNQGGEDSAKQRLNDWKAGNEKSAFIVKHCPWCAAKLGAYPVESGKESQLIGGGGAFSRKSRMQKNVRKKKNEYEIAGYDFNKQDGQLRIYCPDDSCPFHDLLPVYIVDETIYNVRPTFIIGTVDKFAMLSWRPEARRLFGLNMMGERELSPPNLIIQDELHLISGPLGSMTGLYELLIEELCTDRRNNKEIKPKIICATATIRGFKEQIEGLFARKDSYLFPSSGLSYDDSFFARTHLDETGKPSRGRKYIGLLSNLVGLQTLQVKVYSTLLQKVTEFEESDRDPYWTLLSFYNSIRELGGSLTLFQTDIPSYFLQLKNKHHIKDKRFRRYLNSFKELTSRLDSGEIAEAIQILKRRYNEGTSVDVCLASNIIEVGVDIDRLSLMSVIGQPKNTAQYIQVTGRVGRSWFERPGLVLTLYKSSISRDKSHFEHFKEYHQKLYSHVEATSVTPFSEPCMERGLYGLIIGWLRQFHDSGIAFSPENIQEYRSELDRFKSLFLDRVKKVDSNQYEVAKGIFEKFISHMMYSHAQRWEDDNSGETYFLMYQAGSHVNEFHNKTAKPVLTSMRNVDASCQGTITNEYLLEEQNEH